MNDTIVNTAVSVFHKLLNTLIYFYNTKPYSIAIKFITAVVLFYILIVILKKLFRSTTGKSANFSSSARNALKHGDYTTAADFYMYDGNLSKAYDLYIKAGAKRKASEIALRMNNISTAINLLVESGDLLAAAKIAKNNNNFIKAADIYTTLKSYIEAASAYEQAKEYIKAARMYENAEMFQPAAELYLKMNDTNKAAQCYLKAFGNDYSKEKMEIDYEYTIRMKDLAGKTGALLSKVGRHEKAARVYASMKLYGMAAAEFKAAGKLMESGEYLTRINKSLEAALLFEEAGDITKANTVRAEHYKATGELQKAAECYKRINEYMNAADLYTGMMDYPKAGEMYERAEEYELAAQMYENAKEFQHAAELYQRAGNLEKARQLYESTGEKKKLVELLVKEKKFIDAAERYTKLGDVDNTIRALQKVPSTNEKEYFRACVLLGDLFVNKGMFVQAIEKYKKAIGSKPLDKGTIDAYYGIAAAFEATDETSKALMIYNKILAEDYNYKDTQARIKKLEALPAKKPGIKTEESIRYRIVKEIGRGNMGKVYEAYDNVLERKVAYKIPSLDLTHHPESVNDFLREAKSAAALNHPNIVIVYDAGKQGGDYYIAMELVYGKTLKDILREKGALPPAEALKISEQLAKALVYAHGKNLIHRDIKPGNIMLTEEGIVKLMDFGLAKIIHDTAQYATKIIGTPYYMSPEQIRGDKISFKTDIYSFGVVLYEIIAGSPPFSKGDVYYHHLHIPAPSLKNIAHGTSDKLDNLVARCLQKEVNDRFSTTSELLSVITSLRT